MDEFNNNTNNYLKNNHKKLYQSSSQIDMKSNALRKKPQTNFVSLINNLSSDIKIFYHSTKHCLNQGKILLYNNKFSSEKIFDLIEKNLNEFINKAKYIFKRIKYIHQINNIQRDMNCSSPTTERIFLNNNNDNIKKIIENEVYCSKIFNQSQRNIDNDKMIISPKINKNISDNEKEMIKSSRNSSKDIKLNKRYDFYNIDENSDFKGHSANKIIYNNYNQQYNNLKRNANNNINKKSLINLKKKIIFDKKQDNSSLNSLVLSNSQLLNNNSQSNNNTSKREQKKIFVHLKIILSLLKQLKTIKGNIYIKSQEADNHKNILNKIYKQLIILLKHIFKNNNSVNSNSSLDLSIDNKNINNNTTNFSFKDNSNYNSKEDINKNININTDYYNKEIKYRDLIIKQMKLNQNKNKINENKNLDKIKQNYLEAKNEKEKIEAENNELKIKIVNLEKQLSEIKNKEINTQIPILVIQKFDFQYLIGEEYIGEKVQKLIDELNSKIKEKNEEIEKINLELNNYKDLDILTKEEINKLKEEKNKFEEEINLIKKEKEDLNMKNNEYINENKVLKDNLEIENKNIEKYKKLISCQEEQINNLKNNLNENNNNHINNNIKSESDAINNINNSKLNKDNNSNNINIEERKNKKRNNSKMNDYQIEQDKIFLKYELLKNDYDKLNNTLQQKQKLLDNYTKISSETASKTNIDEQILELMDKHKKEIDELTQQYNKNILRLRINQPSPYSPETHLILADKRYAKYDLKWYLLTLKSEEEKSYENTFWVPELEMKPIMGKFNEYKTEREIEDEKFDNLYKMQEKWIRKIDENEKIIESLKERLSEYENI